MELQETICLSLCLSIHQSESLSYHSYKYPSFISPFINYLSIHQLINLFIHRFTYVSIHLSIILSIRFSIYLIIYLLIYQNINLSIHLLIQQFFYLSNHPFVHQLIYPFTIQSSTIHTYTTYRIVFCHGGLVSIKSENFLTGSINEQQKGA